VHAKTDREHHALRFGCVSSSAARKRFGGSARTDIAASLPFVGATISVVELSRQEWSTHLNNPPMPEMRSMSTLDNNSKAGNKASAFAVGKSCPIKSIFGSVCYPPPPCEHDH
jgi:hypothetical protein